MPPAWQISGFTEIRELGSGASGRVVMARRDDDGGVVAIKYLSEELLSDGDFLTRFRHEARLLEMVDNPQIARFYQYVESPYGAAIVMELVDGVSLRALLRSQGPTGPQAALAVLKGALLGLAAAHQAGVVHRDFKPENVLVRDDGVSKLVDFGVAGHVGEGDMVGTPPYMAPEQWAGAPATPATDVYAATVVFFECLTGTRPFRARHVAALAHEHQTARPPLHEIPPALHGLVERGMAKLPSQRPSSAQAFIAELEEVAARAYGADWEHRGHRRLAALAGLLAMQFPQAELIPHGHTTLGETLLDNGRARAMVDRVGVKIAVGIGCVSLIGVVGIALLNVNGPAVRPQQAVAGSITPVSDPQPTSASDAPATDPIDTLPIAAPPTATEPVGPEEPEEPIATLPPEPSPTRTNLPSVASPRFVDTKLGVLPRQRETPPTPIPTSALPEPPPAAVPTSALTEPPPAAVPTARPLAPPVEDVLPPSLRPVKTSPPTVFSCNPCIR